MVKERKVYTPCGKTKYVSQPSNLPSRYTHLRETRKKKESDSAHTSTFRCAIYYEVLANRAREVKASEDCLPPTTTNAES